MQMNELYLHIIYHLLLYYLLWTYGHGFIGYPKGRNDERALGFSLTGTVSTSPNLAKEGARSATIITRPSGSRFS